VAILVVVAITSKYSRITNIMLSFRTHADYRLLKYSLVYGFAKRWLLRPKRLYRSEVYHKVRSSRDWVQLWRPRTSMTHRTEEFPIQRHILIKARWIKWSR
jgi:hypothetical protein